MLIFTHGVVFGFRHLLLNMTASSRHTLNATLKLNDKADYSFAPAFA